MATDQDERYFQVLPDVQLEKARMDEAFDEVDASGKKQIRAIARDLPLDTEAEFGTAIKGLVEKKRPNGNNRIGGGKNKPH